MEMAPVLGIAQHFTRLGQHGLGDWRGFFDAAVRGQEVDLAPVFPRFQRPIVYPRGEPDAKAFLEVKSHDQNSRAARKIGSLFPQRAVRGLVVLSYLQHQTPNGLIGRSPIYVSTLFV